MRRVSRLIEKKKMGWPDCKVFDGMFLVLLGHGMDKACLYPEIMGDADCMALVDGRTVEGDRC